MMKKLSSLRVLSTITVIDAFIVLLAGCNKTYPIPEFKLSKDTISIEELKQGVSIEVEEINGAEILSYNASLFINGEIVYTSTNDKFFFKTDETVESASLYIHDIYEDGDNGKSHSQTLSITITESEPEPENTIIGGDEITTDGGTLQLSVKTNYDIDYIDWSLENNDIGANIDIHSGLLEASGEDGGNGTVTVKAIVNYYLYDDNGYISGYEEMTLTKDITISNQITQATGITVTGENNATTITTDGGSLQMLATPVYKGISDITWSIEGDAHGATISSSGLLTASGEDNGNGVVTVNAEATAEDGSTISETKDITISNQSSIILVTEIIVTGQGGATTITTAGGTLQMLAEVNPSDADEKTVTWSIEGENYGATISTNGLLTASGASGGDGTVTVKATAIDGSGIVGTKDITISNQNPVILITNITITNSDTWNVGFEAGGTLQMTATTTPSNPTDPSLTWSIVSSEYGDGMTINSETGLLTAQAFVVEFDSDIVVRATANDGSGVTAEKTIHVVVVW